MTRTAPVGTGGLARRRRERRHAIGLWVSITAMLILIGAFVAITIGFNNSWWTQRHPVASHGQVAPDGSSTFSQSGIDYFTRKGVVNVELGADRPPAFQLGLADAAVKHIDFSVPLHVRLMGARSVTLVLVDEVDLVSTGGRLSAVEITRAGSEATLLGDVDTLAPDVGWSDSAVSEFTTALAASRLAHHDKSYSAAIGPSSSTGMRASATLSSDTTSGTALVIRFAAPSERG